MYCKNCGKEIDDNAIVCIHCGSTVSDNPKKSSSTQQIDEGATPALQILSFLIPLVGLILFIVYYQDNPTKANECGKMALIGFILGIVLYGCAVGCTAASVSSYYY